MAETLTIRTASSTEIVKIAVPGPQGPKGDKGDPGDVAGLPLTTQGDTLYRGASQNERLAIGSTGQVLKVSAQGLPSWANESGAVTSVNGETGAVTVSVPTASSATPIALGTAAAGTATAYAREDHVHSADLSDSAFRVVGSSDATKKVAFEVDGITTATTRTITVPDANITLDDASDSRTPSSHSSSHASAGSDPLAPSDIGAQSLFTTTTLSITADTNLSAARATIYNVSVGSAGSWKLIPATAGSIAGDVIIVFHQPIGSGNALTFTNGLSPSGIQTIAQNERYRFVYSGTVWQADPVYTHTHAASAITSGTLTHERGGLEADVSAYSGLVKISGGSTSAVGIGTGSTEVAAGDHGHGNLTSDGKLGSTSGLPVVTTTAGAVTTLALGTANQVLRVNSGASGVEFADPAASGVTGAAASASDVLGVSGANITGVDANADRIVYWNNTSNKLAYGTPADAGAAAASHTHAASDITSGTIDTARLASGAANSGTFLRGDQTWAAAGGVTTGSVDNAILRADGVSGSQSQSSDINIEDATTSTQNNVAITNQHSGQTNSALVLQPKGTGALIAGARPTGAASTGNARGVAAIDLQMTRSAATQVASGDYAVIGGGRGNTASANDNVVCGGRNNTASSNFSDIYPAAVCGGYNNTASSFGCFVGGGVNNTASTNRASLCAGDGNTSSGYASFVGAGDANTANATYASVLGGNRSLADRYGLFANAAGMFAATGDAQRIRAVLRCKTTTNAAVEMALDGSTTYLTIPSGKVIFCNIKVVGSRSTGAEVATYERQYAVKNVAGTSSEVFAPVFIGTDNAAGTTLEVAVVDAGDYIRVRPTGVASQTWRWVASVDAVEVAYGT